MSMYPTTFQKKMYWAAITAVSLLALVAVVVLVGWVIVQAIGLLKPLVVPAAVAGILSYLLEPVVRLLVARRIPRLWSVILVFAALCGIMALIVVWVAPSAYRQVHQFTEKLPAYSQRTQQLVLRTMDQSKKLLEVSILRKPDENAREIDPVNAYTTQMIQESVQWAQSKIPDMVTKVWSFIVDNFVYQGVNRVFAIVEFFIGIVLIPVFLFFFLVEGSHIAARWSDYVPLHASPLKREVVSLLTEINHYLVSFFRGQLVVSMIDGLLLAIGLLIVRVDFAVLIGLTVGILGLIPYAGVAIVWVPAVLITVFQFGDWLHPLIVTGIFLLVYKLDGFVISPRVVGDSVGLHPLTVIISVLAWSLILGGLLGALLAVPLTATIKVVLKRYFWDRDIVSTGIGK